MASTPSQSPSRPTGPHALPMSGEVHAVDENAPSDAERHTNDTSDDDGTGESLGQGAFDLASIRTLLPRRNYSAHPNIKLLPGLDFGIPETAPFTSRISRIIVVAADVYHTHNVFSLRVIFDYAFRELRDKDRTWYFASAARKSSVIMEKILEARKRFIANGYDTSKIQPCFLHFLNALDDFTRIVEGGLKAEQLKTNDATTLLNTSRKRTGNHLSKKVVVPWKVRRSHHDEDNDDTQTTD
ncbi:hypothetical protein CGLO_14328 [Colletotrichum gloeosporioides Cg-14]|uniref:Uncharacterized protein n=1 Tax=Colletotrichum gloeosporioides (strain Cg-14) TaxID=1237896 RepID=T0K465_COLGC|nr:hypothetical protein CGLO_14328 [Colletotrichum gloeosporioides Cg-14]